MTLPQVAAAAASAAAAVRLEGRLSHPERSAQADWQPRLAAALDSLLPHHTDALQPLSHQQLLQLAHSCSVLGVTCRAVMQAAVAVAADGASDVTVADRSGLLADCARAGQPLRRSEVAAVVAALPGGAVLQLPPAGLVAALWGLVKYKQPVTALLGGKKSAPLLGPALARLRATLPELPMEELLMLLSVTAASPSLGLDPPPSSPDWTPALDAALAQRLPHLAAGDVEAVLAALMEAQHAPAAPDGGPLHKELLAAVSRHAARWAPPACAGAVHTLACLGVAADRGWCDGVLAAFLRRARLQKAAEAKKGGDGGVRGVVDERGSVTLHLARRAADGLVAGRSAGHRFGQRATELEEDEAEEEQQVVSQQDEEEEDDAGGEEEEESAARGAARGAALLLCSLPMLLSATARPRWAAGNTAGLEALGAATAPHLRRASPDDLLMMAQAWAKLQFYPGREWVAWHATACERSGDLFEEDQLVRLRAALRMFDASPTGKLHLRVKTARLRLRKVADTRLAQAQRRAAGTVSRRGSSSAR